jgi:hypothetical protein
MMTSVIVNIPRIAWTSLPHPLKKGKRYVAGVVGYCTAANGAASSKNAELMIKIKG